MSNLSWSRMFWLLSQSAKVDLVSMSSLTLMAKVLHLFFLLQNITQFLQMRVQLFDGALSCARSGDGHKTLRQGRFLFAQFAVNLEVVNELEGLLFYHKCVRLNSIIIIMCYKNKIISGPVCKKIPYRLRYFLYNCSQLLEITFLKTSFSQRGTKSPCDCA